MKTLEQWFDEYSVSHQNKTNKAIHYICVPAIFFSIVGLLMSIPTGFIENVLPFQNPFIENWATAVLMLVLFFYVRLSLSMAFKIVFFAALCVFLNYQISLYLPLWAISLGIFVVAWVGQFYGHKIEGKKPSFLKDLQFLLIGPAWVLDNLFRKS
ncbi:DUF962 domain-containing protein [Leptobacterium sp. I13]|uniref:Mpo1 family 2-hydroxy fatty acid dioxygenase n=1 Tax=Leptobacterium meishanense TaxID=3128904 RepID=UPI0030EDD94F